MLTLGFSALFTLGTTLIFENLNMAIISIPILLAIRSFIAEAYVAKIMKISVTKDAIMEFLLVLVFMYTGWSIFNWIGITLYGLFFMVYFVIKWKDIRSSIQTLRVFMKS